MTKREFYTADWCAGCKQRKAILDSRGLLQGIEFIDAETDPRASGLRGLPKFKLDGEFVSWEQFLESF